MASDERKPATPAGTQPGSDPKAAERTRLIAAFEPLSDRLLGVTAKEAEVYGYFNSTDSEELLAKYAPFTSSSPLLRLGKEVARLLEKMSAEERKRLIGAFTVLLAQPRGEKTRPVAESEPFRLAMVGPYRVVYWYDRPFDAVRISWIDRRAEDPVTQAIDRYLASGKS